MLMFSVDFYQNWLERKQEKAPVTLRRRKKWRGLGACGRCPRGRRPWPGGDPKRTRRRSGREAAHMDAGPGAASSGR